MCQVKVWGEKAESKLLHSLPGWLSFILHHTPAQPLQLPSYKSRGSHGSALPKQLERKGWRQGTHLSTCTKQRCLSVPPCSFSYALRAGSVPRQALLELQLWSPGPWHPSCLPGRELCWECSSTEGKSSASPAQVQLPTGAVSVLLHSVLDVCPKGTCCHFQLTQDVTLRAPMHQVQAPPHLHESALFSFMTP